MGGRPAGIALAMHTKTCRVCKAEKPLEEFYLHKTNKDGHKGECKICYCEARKGVRSPKKQESDLFMEPEQWPKFRDAISSCVPEEEVQRWQYLWYLIAATGVRIGEAVALQLSDLNPSKPIVTITTLKRKGHPRIDADLPMDLWLGLLGLEKEGGQHIRGTGLTDYKVLFPWTENTCWYVFKRIAKKAGINQLLSPHSLRHLFATRLVKITGGNIIEIQKALRHASPRTSEKYVHLTAKRRKEIADKVFEDL